MPNQQVALIRGINVGKAKRISMAVLRTLVEALGFSDVKTLLNSGNVVFTNRAAQEKAAAKIEKGLKATLGVAARVTVVTAADIATVVADNPLLKVADNPSRTFVAFLNDAADLAEVKPLVAQKWGNEKLALGNRVVYFWCPDGILESPLAKAIAKALGNGVTTRNWATVLKLHDMCHG